MKLLVCGAAGFIGSTFVGLRVREHGDEVTVLDALTYAGREENLQDVADDIRFVQGADRGSRGGGGCDRGCGGDREFRGRDACRSFDR